MILLAVDARAAAPARRTGSTILSSAGDGPLRIARSAPVGVLGAASTEHARGADGSRSRIRSVRSRFW